MTVRGRRYRMGGIPTQRKALEMITELQLNARLEKLGLIPKRVDITIAELGRERLADPLIKQRQTTVRMLGALKDVIPESTPVTKLDATHLRKLVGYLHERELMPGTINTYIAALSAMLKSAPTYFAELSQHRWPKLPWLPVDEGRTRILSAEEISKILCALLVPRFPYESQESYDHRDDVGDCIRLALLLAARENELLSLKSADVNWDWHTIKIYGSKTSRTRVIPMSPQAMAIIKPRSQSERLFNGFDDDSLQNWCAAAGERAGVPWGQKVENGWTFHDLRRTAATVMETDGAVYSAISAILGHKRRDQTATYTPARQDQMRNALNSLGKWCQEIVGFQHHFRGFSGFRDNLKNRFGG